MNVKTLGQAPVVPGEQQADGTPDAADAEFAALLATIIGLSPAPTVPEVGGDVPEPTSGGGPADTPAGPGALTGVDADAGPVPFSPPGGTALPAAPAAPAVPAAHGGREDATVAPDAAAPERAAPPAGGPAPAPARMALPAFDVPNPAGPGAENPPGSGQGTGGGTPPPGGRGAQAPPRVGTLPNPAETPFPGVGTQASPGRPDAPATPPPGGTPTVDPARPAPTPGAPPPLAVPANVPAGRGAGGVVGTGGAGAPTPSVEPETPHGQIATVLTPLRRRADGTYRLTLRIQPPELGRVDLEVRLQGGRVNVRMLAELEETGSLLRASLGELRADLSDAGFRPGDLDLGRWGERARDAGDGLDSGGRPARDAEGDRLPGSPTRSRTDAHRLGEGALASRPDSVVDLQL